MATAWDSPYLPWIGKTRDPNELTTGFKERGFLPESICQYACAPWVGTMEQDRNYFHWMNLVHQFSIDRVHKGGRKI